MSVKEQKPIVIFRGDNTAAFDLRTIKILLTGDLDLSHATAKFTLLNFTKSWTTEEVATGELSIVFDSAQTKAFALGPQTGTLRLFDMSTGTPRQLTVVNKIPFFVTNNVCEIDSQSYGVNVRVTSGDVINIEFKVGAGAVEGKADKVTNATAGDLAGLNAEGNLIDSGIPADDVQRKLIFDATPMVGSQNPVTSDGIKQAIDAATPEDYAQVKAKVEQNTNDIADIESLIPNQASASNQLADKSFVNSSIATNTATFRGSYNLVSDLGLTVSATEQQVAAAIATKLASLVPPVVPENNDYCFVQVPKTDAEPTVIERIDRYKCTVTESGGVTTRMWDYEWSLNNSSFTADQWAAINSGITSGDVAKLGALPTAQELAASLLAKYEKPSTGIPKTDLSSGVQASLDKADTALQTAPVTSVNSKTGAVTLSASDVGALGNTGDQNLDGNLSFWSGQLAFEFWDAMLLPVMRVMDNTIYFPSQSGGLAITAGSGHAGNLAALDVYGNPVDSGIAKTAVAPLASPAFTGTPTAPTPSAGDDSTKVATTAFVKTAVAGISVTPLSGKTYDFSTNADVYKAVADIARALGATVTNAPTDPVSTASND